MWFWWVEYNADRKERTSPDVFISGMRRRDFALVPARGGLTNQKCSIKRKYKTKEVKEARLILQSRTYKYIFTGICILGRTYFVERSFLLIEEH